MNLTNVVSFLQLAQMSTRVDQTCFVYSIYHQTYVVYSMDTLNLYCLEYGHIKLTLLTVFTIKVALFTVWTY